MSKFKQGDKVRYIGENDSDLRHGNVYEISVPNDFVAVVEYGAHRIVAIDDLEPLDALSDDPTTAFLTELQALMRKYDVIIVSEGDEAHGHEIIINIGDALVTYPMYELTPDNIFDYEK